MTDNVEYDIEKGTATKYRQATIAAVILAIIFLAGFAVMLGLYISEKNANESSTTVIAPSTTTTMMMTTTAMAPGTYPDWMYKLPKTASPYSYYIIMEVAIPPAGSAMEDIAVNSFNGSVTINAVMIADTDNITMNIDPNYLQLDESQSIQLVNTREIQITNYTVNWDLTMITFQLSSPLYVGENLTMILPFVGALRTDSYGFYVSSYTDQNGVKQYLASTQMEPTSARSVIPCFDEPEYKATFQMNLIHDSNLMALGNMKTLSNETLADGRTITYFYITPKMSSYLLAFFVGPFTCTAGTPSDTVKRTLIRVCARPEFLNETALAQQYGSDVLSWYESYFKVPFPLDKLDLLAVPEFGPGAMENWGLIIYREKDLLYDPATFAKTSQEDVLTTVVHEIAHMWFGDLVTMRWWNDLWLNEAFASLMEFYAGDAITQNQMQVTSQVPVLHRQPSMAIDQQPTSHPIFYQVYTTPEINTMFDDITYDKGACILQMLMNSLIGQNCTDDSPTIFQTGIQMYLSAMQYSNADHNDLFYFLEKAYNQSCQALLPNQLPVTGYFSMWINQMGFPVVMAQQTADQGVALQQEIFQVPNNLSALPISPYGYAWNLYVKVSTFNAANSLQFTELYLPAGNDYQTSIDSIVSNSSFYVIDGGYYRVSYPTSNWAALSNYHNNLTEPRSVLTVPQRADIVDDLFTFAESVKNYGANYSFAFDYICYLPTAEDSTVVWQTAYNHLTFISQMIGVNSTNRMTYNAYSQWLTDDQFNMVQSNNLTNSVLYFQQQYLIWDQSCRAGYDVCVNQSHEYFGPGFKKPCQNYTENGVYCPINNIPPNLHAPVYCSMMMNYNSTQQQKIYDFLLLQYTYETVNNERLNLLYGMSCAQDSTIINNFINESTSDSGVVDPDQRVYVFRYLPLNPAAGQIMWPYVQTNWDSLWNSALAQDGISDVIMGSTADLNQPSDVTSVQNFITMHQNDQQGFPLDYFQQGLAQVQSNVRWTQAYLQTVLNILTGQEMRCMNR